jgi:ABC-type uncharacterized transport system ATPase subunit
MIGYMPEERGLYKKMKVGEQLMYLAQLKGMDAQCSYAKRSNTGLRGSVPTAGSPNGQ